MCWFWSQEPKDAFVVTVSTRSDLGLGLNFKTTRNHLLCNTSQLLCLGLGLGLKNQKILSLSPCQHALVSVFFSV